MVHPIESAIIHHAQATGTHAAALAARLLHRPPTSCTWVADIIESLVVVGVVFFLPIFAAIGVLYIFAFYAPLTQALLADRAVILNSLATWLLFPLLGFFFPCCQCASAQLVAPPPAS